MPWGRRRQGTSKKKFIRPTIHSNLIYARFLWAKKYSPLWRAWRGGVWGKVGCGEVNGLDEDQTIHFHFLNEPSIFINKIITLSKYFF